MLQIKQASKQFKGQVVLDNINLSIPKHTIIGLTGPSGSGKSTLLRCIQNLEALDTGTIELQGSSGFMFQDFQLFPHMTVLQNLSYAPQLHKKNNVEQKALDLLTTLGLLDKQNAYPHQLSGGQKQRVALARSLMMKPDLLLCDEPTSGLDLQSKQQVNELFETVSAMGVSLIIASHDLSFLSQIAQQFIVVKQGKIVADFNKQEKDPLDFIQQLYLGDQKIN